MLNRVIKLMSIILDCWEMGSVIHQIETVLFNEHSLTFQKSFCEKSDFEKYNCVLACTITQTISGKYGLYGPAGSRDLACN